MTINERMMALYDKFQEMESDIEHDLEAQRIKFKYVVEQRRVRFDAAIREHQKTLRRSVRRFLRESTLPAMLVSPAVYIVIVPLLILDLMLYVFQCVCSPVYGIPKVRRADYVVLDRHKLAYLNPIEKLNCYYCGYANGLLAYARAIAGGAEAHWCPIKHALKTRGAHRQYYGFADFGDGEGYRRRLGANRDVPSPTDVEP